MPSDSNTATHVTLRLTGEAVNGTDMIDGKPTRTYEIELNKKGFDMLHRTVDWAIGLCIVSPC